MGPAKRCRRLDAASSSGPTPVVLAVVLALALSAAVTSAAAAQERTLERAFERDGWWEWALLEQAAGERLLTSRGRTVVIGSARGAFGARSAWGARDAFGARDHRARAIDRRLHRSRLQWERVAHRQLRGAPAVRRGSPSFCRSGAAGHPVFGHAWCRDMGFGLGGHDLVWRRGLLDEVFFRRPDRARATPHFRRGILEEAHLIELLGEAVLRQLLLDAGRTARSGPLTGRWLDLAGGGVALQLRSGGVPLAELTDLEGDGRVDALLVAELLTR